MISTYYLFEQEDYPFKTVPELVRWAKKQKLIEKDKIRKPELKEGEFAVRRKNIDKKPMLNKKTGRIKKQKVTSWEITTIKPEDRTLKNLPKYANKKSKVRFQDWLELKKHPKLYEKFDDCSWGWSPNGKCYGWSHRAVHGFKIGDKIKKDTIGNTSGEEWTIKTNEQAEKMAKLFAKDVA